MNIRNAHLIALTAVLSTAVAAPAFAQSAAEDAAAQAAQSQAEPAQQAQSGKGQTWASLDTDGDGAISQAEAQANPGLASVFNEADSNADGKLTPEEYKNYVAKVQGAATGGQSGSR